MTVQNVVITFTNFQVFLLPISKYFSCQVQSISCDISADSGTMETPKSVQSVGTARGEIARHKSIFRLTRKFAETNLPSC